MRSSGDFRDRTDDPVPEIPELLVATVPEPRPELLARVLAGLRDLPETPAAPARAIAHGASPTSNPYDDEADAVLPRRHA